MGLILVDCCNAYEIDALFSENVDLVHLVRGQSNILQRNWLFVLLASLAGFIFTKMVKLI